MNRRDFAKKSILTYLELSILHVGMSNISSCQKMIKENGASNLVTIFLPGAPSRWCSDLFLNPYGKKGVDLNLNKGMANSYIKKNGVYSDSEYLLVKDKEFNLFLPPLWQSDIPVTGGGYSKLSNILNNTVSIQGIDMENGAHFNCQKKFFNNGGKQSLNGLAADSSDHPVDSMNLFSQRDFFKSSKGKKRITISNTINNERYLMKSFADSFFLSKKPLLSDASKKIAQDFQQKFNEFNNIDMTKLERLEEIIKSVDISKLWHSKILKYKKLINKALILSLEQGSLSGVTDLSIGGNIRNKSIYSFGGRDTGQNHKDLRSMFDTHKSYPLNMAEHFAFAEIIIELNISNNIVISPQEFVFLKNINGVSSKYTSHSFDEHTYGVMNTILINSVYHYTLKSCLYEFIKNLKRHNKFEDTLICEASEFNRSPRLDGGGSDHGWSGASVSFYTGLVKDGPILIGDLQKDSDKNYLGYWGKGASTNEFKTGAKLGKISMNNIHSTVAAVLGVPSPYPNDKELLCFKNNRISSLLKKPVVRI